MKGQRRAGPQPKPKMAAVALDLSNLTPGRRERFVKGVALLGKEGAAWGRSGITPPARLADLDLGKRCAVDSKRPSPLFLGGAGVFATKDAQRGDPLAACTGAVWWGKDLTDDLATSTRVIHLEDCETEAYQDADAMKDFLQAFVVVVGDGCISEQINDHGKLTPYSNTDMRLSIVGEGEGEGDVVLAIHANNAVACGDQLTTSFGPLFWGAFAREERERYLQLSKRHRKLQEVVAEEREKCLQLELLVDDFEHAAADGNSNGNGKRRRRSASPDEESDSEAEEERRVRAVETEADARWYREGKQARQRGREVVAMEEQRDALAAEAKVKAEEAARKFAGVQDLGRELHTLVAALAPAAEAE